MSLYPTQNNNNSSVKNSTGGGNSIFPARVKDIILNNNTKFFKESNGWGSLNLIKFKPLYSSVEGDKDSYSIAKPLFSNIKQIPLKEELVLIIVAPTDGLNDNDNDFGYYYMPFPINIWNNNHHNAFPDINKFNRNPNNLELGNTFKEKDSIKALLPEEGDIILEGRYGNSIRFSYTTPNKKTNNNPWSSRGDEGNPILLIRNKQSVEDNDTWIPTYEDINNDGSSIYLCSGQDIPINFACKNLQSLDVTISEPFDQSLQILNNKF